MQGRGQARDQARGQARCADSLVVARVQERARFIVVGHQHRLDPGLEFKKKTGKKDGG